MWTVAFAVQATISVGVSAALLYGIRRSVTPRMRNGSLSFWPGMLISGIPLASVPVVMMLLGMLGLGVEWPLWLVAGAEVVLLVSGLLSAAAVRYIARH